MDEDKNEQTKIEEQQSMWEEKKSSPKKKAEGEANVRLVRQQGQSALIEWQADGRSLRAVIDSIDVHGEGKNTSVNQAALSRALPYGLDFSAVKLPDHDLIKLETELHNNDIWTDEDILYNRPKVMRALNGYNLAVLRALIDFAKQGGK